MPSFSRFRVLNEMLWQIKAIKPYPLHNKIKFQLAKNSCLVVRDIIKRWLQSNNSRWSRDVSRHKLLTSHRKIVNSDQWRFSAFFSDKIFNNCTVLFNCCCVYSIEYSIRFLSHYEMLLRNVEHYFMNSMSHTFLDHEILGAFRYSYVWRHRQIVI